MSQVCACSMHKESICRKWLHGEVKRIQVKRYSDETASVPTDTTIRSDSGLLGECENEAQ